MSSSDPVLMPATVSMGAHAGLTRDSRGAPGPPWLPMPQLRARPVAMGHRMPRTDASTATYRSIRGAAGHRTTPPCPARGIGCHARGAQCSADASAASRQVPRARPAAQGAGGHGLGLSSDADLGLGVVDASVAVLASAAGTRQPQGPARRSAVLGAVAQDRVTGPREQIVLPEPHRERSKGTGAVDDRRSRGGGLADDRDAGHLCPSGRVPVVGGPRQGRAGRGPRRASAATPGGAIDPGARGGSAAG